MKHNIFDGHNDTVSRIGDVAEFLNGNGKNHIDFPRLKETGFSGGFFAMFSSGDDGVSDFESFQTIQGYSFPLGSSISLEESQKKTNQLFAKLVKIEQKALGQFKLVRSVADLQVCFKENIIACVAHMEGADSIDADLNALYVYYEAGLRSLGLVWSRPNIFATGVPYHFPSSPDIGEGLTKTGEMLVRACNELGIMIDLSHLNEKGFWDVNKITDAPLVATHSNVHALCPISRNLTDHQLDAIGDSNGVVGVTYAVNMLHPKGKLDESLSLNVIVEHITYIANKIGIDHVALGSDFDGATIPGELRDVTGVPKILKLLQERGYSKNDIEKISCLNWRRVLEDTWK